MKLKHIIGSCVLLSIFVVGCKNDTEVIEPSTPIKYIPTPYTLEIPDKFPQMPIPDDNPLTVEGVALGRKLFYDPILSKDNTVSCGSCHSLENAFSDDKQFSEGVDNQLGDRNAMAIFNLGWNIDFFWDGRSRHLEDQALGPVTNPVEMHLSWTEAATRLNAHPEYPLLFEQALGVTTIDSGDVAKAIAQFERTIISGNSKFDQKEVGKYFFTQLERDGEIIYFTEKGDCFHCHGGPLFTFNTFHNNGLDAIPTDIGLGKVTGLATDNGKFKAPSLRNIEKTAPYMHDGRFATLEEVIDFYHTGVEQTSPNIDGLMTKENRKTDGELALTDYDKQALLAFLKTLTDEEFLTMDAYKDPNK